MIEDENIELLINDVFELYGYDFTDYSRASLRRRINRLCMLDKFPSFAELRYRVRNDPHYLKRFVEEITVNVTEMFRDPGFYQVLRTEILPKLGTHPYIRIWHAGCSTGEEVYSMAILLKEANLLHKSILYATDLNPDVLEKARAGIFPIAHMKHYSENYMAAGGREDFSSYYSANYDGVKFDESLSKQMVFSAHNLVSDSSFNEFHLIICRNVLIYFDKQLQDRVFELFDKSLGMLSYLALGSKETIKFSTIHAKYKQTGKEKIWRKIK
jgi:chemotaxis protein methyltransferase CheR